VRASFCNFGAKCFSESPTSSGTTMVLAFLRERMSMVVRDLAWPCFALVNRARGPFLHHGRRCEEVAALRARAMTFV
jgi:hypothetical protein